MIPEKNNDISRSIKSFSFAWNGLKIAFSTQVNFKIQTIAGLIVFFAAFLLDFMVIEWIMLIFIVSIVLIAELVNTAIEIITDHLFPEYHLTAGKIKDIAAAAVLITAFTALVAGLLLFLPKIF